MRLRPFSVFIVFVAAAGLVVSMEPSPANAQTTCRYNTDCDDGLFCNGVELCMPSTAGADARGCVRRGNGPCPGVLCLEETKRCAAPDPRCDKTPDRDGDGHRAYECGGTDCDDDDPERYPGRPEVCDAAGHDEDCDPRTVGNKDDDHDGFVDAACKNVVRLIPSTKGRYLAPPSVAATTYVFYGGTDCDDNDAHFGPHTQVCTPAGIRVCSPTPKPASYPSAAPPRFEWQYFTCAAGQSCVPQPNGGGVCVGPPSPIGQPFPALKR